MKGKQATIIAIVAIAAALPVHAGAPDNPGEKGQIVNRDKAYWQEETGEKNAWGQTVSRVATDDKGNPDNSLGEHLRNKARGPNPDNDQGKGND